MTLKDHANRLGIESRTLKQVETALADAKAQGSDTAMARLMLKHGRLTSAAESFVRAYLERNAS